MNCDCEYVDCYFHSLDTHCLISYRFWCCLVMGYWVQSSGKSSTLTTPLTAVVRTLVDLARLPAAHETNTVFWAWTQVEGI